MKGRAGLKLEKASFLSIQFENLTSEQVRIKKTATAATTYDLDLPRPPAEESTHPVCSLHYRATITWHHHLFHY